MQIQLTSEQIGNIVAEDLLNSITTILTSRPNGDDVFEDYKLVMGMLEALSYYVEYTEYQEIKSNILGSFLFKEMFTEWQAK